MLSNSSPSTQFEGKLSPTSKFNYAYFAKNPESTCLSWSVNGLISENVDRHTRAVHSHINLTTKAQSTTPYQQADTAIAR